QALGTQTEDRMTHSGCRCETMKIDTGKTRGSKSAGSLPEPPNQYAWPSRRQVTYNPAPLNA
ncbi:hypothetical protein O6495_23705, partial [Salmonella enterica subsp. enterica]